MSDSERFIPNRNQRSQPKKGSFFFHFLPFSFFKSNFNNLKKKKKKKPDTSMGQGGKHSAKRGWRRFCHGHGKPLTVIFLSASEINTFIKTNSSQQITQPKTNNT